MHVLPPTFRSALLLALAATGASFAVSACGDGSAAGRRADAGNDTAGIAPNPDTGDDTSGDDAGDTGRDTGADTDAADVAGPDVDEEYGVVRCLDDSVCDGDRCIFLIPDREGFCFPRCISTVNCPEGSVCLGLANSGGDLEQVCVPLDLCVDEDEDGWGEGPGCRGQDCDDADPRVNFGAQEVCDGRDNNCDGLVDNNPIDAGQRCETGFAGVCAQGLTACRNSSLLCEPLNEPSPEICDGLDNDCDGTIDEDATDAPRWFRDADGDRFGDPDDFIDACARPTGYVDDGTDCDDTDRAVNPVANEVCDGRDTNCDGEIDNVTDGTTQTWYRDADGDGFGDASAPLEACARPAGYAPVAGDCDDTNPDVFPGATEVCNGVDDNCDGRIDPPSAEDARNWFPDRDLDGYGDPSEPVRACTAPAGHVGNNLDCNDANPDVNPDATEVCDGIDNNCDGRIDEPGSVGELTFWVDEDGDGYGDPTRPVNACVAPPGTVTNAEDCDDTNRLVNPGAAEVCDGIDNNCDGQIDVGAIDAPTWFQDADGDTFGNPAAPLRSCTQPPGYVANNTDCNDGNAAVNPSRPEVCNGIDDNCNGQIDEGVQLSFWPDADGDGFGNRSAAPVVGCSAPPGHVANNGDCNDAIARINPAAAEVCDGWDNNCNGVADTGTCPAGCLGHAWGVRGYMTCRPGFGIQRDAAQNICADAGRGMDLVRIDSAAENIAVGQMAINHWGTSWGQLWIGASDRGSDRSFYWQDGTGVTFTAWASGEPNNFRGREDCADMDRNVGNLGDGVGFRWRDVGCGNTRNEFVCRWR